MIHHEAKNVEWCMAERSRNYLILADEDLISLVEKGNEQAFACLYDRHSRVAYSLAYRMMGEPQAAEDLVQESFLQLWRSAKRYQPSRGSLRTWLLSIVHNRGIDHLRQMESRRRTQSRVEVEAPTSHPNDAFNEAWSNSRRETVRDALKELPPEQLKVLELAYFSGYTHVEISEFLNVPLGTVKGRMRLGLKKIREHLGPGGTAVMAE